MKVNLKPVSEQVVVVVGASSGIGLVTAKEAARRGARVVLVARGEDGLRRAVEDIRAEGGEALSVVADVAEPEALERVADTVLREYGGFDSWVNDASVAIYGRLDEIPLEDKRRLFDVNFWGVVHGCRAAVPHLRERGGALVNVGSSVGDRAVPLLGIYSASKHAVKAYTDALRMELEHDGYPVSVSLVTPSSINTPFFEHAKHFTDRAPRPYPPVYAPELVANAILACCERPIRDIAVGSGGKMISVMGRYTPRIADRVLEATAFEQQQYDDLPPVETDNLYSPQPGAEHGRYDGHVAKSSVYTAAALNPAGAFALLAGVAGLALGASRLLRQRGRRPTEDTLPADDELETRGPGVISETEDFTTPGTTEIEVTRRVALSADSAEGGAHVPGGSGRTEHPRGAVYGWGVRPDAGHAPSPRRHSADASFSHERGIAETSDGAPLARPDRTEAL